MVGALVGGGENLAWQMVVEGKSFECVDWWEVGGSTLLGGLTGGIAGSGLTGKVGIHGPHHSFGSLGRRSHIQVNVWRRGVRGSGRAFRIPLPWR